MFYFSLSSHHLVMYSVTATSSKARHADEEKDGEEVEVEEEGDGGDMVEDVGALTGDAAVDSMLDDLTARFQAAAPIDEEDEEDDEEGDGGGGDGEDGDEEDEE